ncbi:MAG: TPM domain-containing protein [Lewinellaceae bacterium]|nr:TPM domain-containing protein [Lewinellaceae bacterium]
MVNGGRWTVDGRRRKIAEPRLKHPALLPTAAAYVYCVLFLFLPLFALAQQDDDLFPPKPDPAVYVHDYAGWLSSGERMALEQKLVRYYDSTSTQIVVMIRPDIGDYDKSSYAFELGNRWGIGRKDKNNGIVLLVKTEQPGRGAFIATGYGTEGALPDITAGRIIRNTMIPYFKQEQYAQGIDAGTDEIIRALSGEFTNEGEKGKGGGILILIAILIIILLVIISMVRAAKGTWYTHDGTGLPRRSIRRGNDNWGGWGGGGFGGGGGSGWGGGGGGSFGGGSFGGGGAGGDW